MSKQIMIAVVLALTSGLALSACGGSGGETTPAEPVAMARPEPAPAAPAPLPPRDHTALAATTAPAVPASPPAPEPVREARAEERAEVRVRRLVVTRGIEAREPVDALDVLDRGEGLERVYAFVEAANAGEGEGALEVTFERHDGFVTGMVTLDVPARAARHRTWAFSRGVRTEGDWRAVVRDEHGRVLAEQPFTVE